jgi:hypothetical protein
MSNLIKIYFENMFTSEVVEQDEVVLNNVPDEPGIHPSV